MKTKVLLFFILTFILGGCTSEAQKEAVTELRIAQLIDDGNPQSGVVFENFRAELEAYLEMPVIGIEGATHVVGIEAMRAGNLDVMWGAPFVYLLAQEATDVERLVVTDNPEAINKTVFITQQGRSDITSLETFEGHSFAFISPSSSSGFLYPMYHLMTELELEKDVLMHGGSFFSAVTYSGSQDASIMGVVRGDFDIAGVGFLNLQSLIASGMISEDDITIVDYTERIPFPGYIAGNHLPAELIERIRGFMLAYDDEEYFEQRFRDPQTRFVLPDEASISHLASMVEALGIDLEAQ